MNSSLNLTEDQQLALLESLTEICSVFWGPDHPKCVAMLQGIFFKPFDKLNSLPDFHIHEALKEIRSIITELANAAHLLQHLEESYVRLFISNRTGIMAPLYESCYVSGDNGQNASLMGEPAIMMKKRLQSNGLSIGDSLHEPPDHISIELEYLYYLLEKGWAEGSKTLINEAVSFASKIMLPWISELQERLAVESECRFYFLIASILTAILRFISAFEKMGSQKEG